MLGNHSGSRVQERGVEQERSCGDLHEGPEGRAELRWRVSEQVSELESKAKTVLTSELHAWKE